ncbi:MAG: hypothetical protein M1368_08200 [Thaumarchaeota archaeon]|nr:hypothetical protein [Nitrososphaerota archaeon]
MIKLDWSKSDSRTKSENQEGNYYPTPNFVNRLDAVASKSPAKFGVESGLYTDQRVSGSQQGSIGGDVFIRSKLHP